MSDPLPTPRTAPAPNSGKNGEAKSSATILDRALFAEVVEQRDREPEAEEQESPEAAAKTAPENAENPPEHEDPENENLTEESTEAEDQEAEAEEADETDLSQSGDKEIDEALKGLNADAKKHLLEMVEAVSKGETSLGQLKRQLKLGRAENEELTRLRTENEQLRSAPATIVAGKDIPANVAKLKTAQEVEARTQQCESAIDAIEDFLDANPTGGTIGEGENAKEFTREQLLERKRAMRDELKALPKHGATLQQQAQLQANREAVRAEVVKDYPYLKDPENADTKTYQHLLKERPEFKQFPNGDYLALCMARGHRELQAEKTARTKGGTAARPGATRPVVKTAGTVPAGKPHAAGGGAPARTSKGTAPVDQLLKGVKDKSSFADLIEATGR